MKKAIILFLCIYSSVNNFAQNENTKWYFGENAALNFLTNPPTVLNNSEMDANQGCSSIADAAGNLLFYTNGVKIWDRQHSIMANGTMSIAGGFTGSYPLIIKQPGNSNLYYIFTTFPPPFIVTLPVPPPVITHGLYYSVVDMNLAAGMGSVIVNNALIYTAPFNLSNTRQLHATKHANGLDYWIMIHQYGNNNNFQAYHLSSTGINPMPVVSSIGLAYQGGSDGYLKFSPTGQKLCTSVSYAGVELYDFDNSSGLLSNPLTLLSNGLEKNYRGCEFSPDGTKLYLGHNIAGSTNSKLIQWDLSALSNSAIVSSSVNIASNSLDPFALQLATNGKIYIATPGSQFLSVINNPNATGANCNLIMGGQTISAAINTTLNSSSHSDLPNMVTNTTNAPCVTQIVNNPQNICAGDLYAISNQTYTTAGIYTDTIQNIFSCNGVVIVNTQLTVNSLPNISVSTNSTICLYQTLTLTANGANTYTWNNSVNGSQYVSPTFTTTGSFIYSVQLQGTGSSNCVRTDTVSLSILVQACDVGVKLQDLKWYSDNIKIFPNPTEKDLNVVFDNHVNIDKVMLINSLGQTLREEDCQNKNKGFVVSTSDLDIGIYLIQFRTPVGNLAKKFIKN